MFKPEFEFTGTFLACNIAHPISKNWVSVVGTFSGRAMAYSLELNGERHLLFTLENGSVAGIPISNRSALKVV